MIKAIDPLEIARRIFCGGVRAKPRVRIFRTGWIRHEPGPFPFDKTKVWVEVLFERGNVVGDQLANYWPDDWWRQRAMDWRWNIIAYRIVANPRPGA